MLHYKLMPDTEILEWVCVENNTWSGNDAPHKTPRARANPYTRPTDRTTISPPASLSGFTGTNNTVPSRRASTLLTTNARIIQIAARTSGHSTPSHPAYRCSDRPNPVANRIASAMLAA